MSLLICPNEQCPTRDTCPHAKLHSAEEWLVCGGGLDCPPCEWAPAKEIQVKVITIQQPYAHYCIYGHSHVEFGRTVHPDIKNIENRTWGTQFRGRLYIHAGKSWYGGADTRNEIREEYPPIFELMQSEMGHIIGHVDMTGCVTTHQSPWFGGPFGFVFENATILPKFIPARGSLGFWDATIEVAA